MSFIKQNIFSVFLFTLLAFFTACVSVELPKKTQVVKSTEVTFVAPRSPFVSMESADLDQGWKNPQNGNSISFISECNSSVDPSLENIHNGVIKGIESVEVSKSEKINYNGRQALRSTVVGNVDGVASKIDFVILKKNGCTYVITYVALQSKFDENAAEFEKFVEGFKAP